MLGKTEFNYDSLTAEDLERFTRKPPSTCTKCGEKFQIGDSVYTKYCGVRSQRIKRYHRQCYDKLFH